MKKEAGTPLYKKIQADIRYEIANGILKPGDKIMPEYDMMEEYKVSRITVSKALTQLSASNIIERIPGRGSFITDDAPKIIQEQDRKEKNISPAYLGAGDSSVPRKQSIGVIMPIVGDHVSSSLILGIYDVLKVTDCSLWVRFTGNRELESKSIQELMSIGVQGIIAFPVDNNTYNEHLIQMKFHDFPLVLIDRTLPGIETHYVIADNYMGAGLAVTHLYDYGHRNIAFCSSVGTQIQTISERYRGYTDSLKKYALPLLHDFTLFAINQDYDHPEANPTLVDIIQNKRVSAFVTADLSVARYLYHLILSLGYRIPEDFSLISFDDPIYSIESMELFTYIKQPSYEIGRDGARILLDIIQHEPTKYQQIVKEPTLVIGKSTRKI